MPFRLGFVVACAITITSVTGVPTVPGSTTTKAIRVHGTVSGCPPDSQDNKVKVVVTAACGNNEAKEVATADPSGNWSVEIPLGCTCNLEINVTATCATDAMCVSPLFVGNLQCEGTCPTGYITWSPGTCNDNGTRNVSLTANVTSIPAGPAPTGQFYYGGTAYGAAHTFTTTGIWFESHAFPTPGPHLVEFVWVPPPTCDPFTATVSGLQTCPIVCPTNVTIDITTLPPGPCNADGTRTVTFNVTVSGMTPEYFHWDFGDGSPIDTETSPVSVNHDYKAPGTATTSYPVQLEVTTFNGACPYKRTTSVFIEGCGGGGGGGEDGGCRGVRWAGVILAIMAALSLYICTCVPAASGVFCWVALGLAIAAALLLAGWALSPLCPKPCGAALLIAWQISLGAGIGALYFAPCCPYLWIIGAGLIVAAIAGIIEWRRRCKVKWCGVLSELAIVITVVIVPILGWIAGIPFLTACLNPIVAASVSTISAAIAIGLANCVHHFP